MIWFTRVCIRYNSYLMDSKCTYNRPRSTTVNRMALSTNRLIGSSPCFSMTSLWCVMVLYCILLHDQILVFSTPTGVCEVVLYVHAWSLYLQQQQVYFCSFSAVFLHFTVHLFNIPNALISSKKRILHTILNVSGSTSIMKT